MWWRALAVAAVARASTAPRAPKPSVLPSFDVGPPVELPEEAPHVEEAAPAAPPPEATRAWQPGDALSHLAERAQLASAFRALASRGLSAASGLGNHLTMSVGPDYECFLLNRYGLHWMEVTAENLLLVDGNGEILEGEGPAQGAAIALHAPIHRELGAKARVIFHTHQPWFTALSCIKTGGLRMFHPDACIYEGRVGFDPVYTGNWPEGSLQGSMMEGERLLRVPELVGKDLCFLGNHGTLQIASSIEEALFDCFNVERLCKAQVYAMQSTRFRELGRDKALNLKARYEKVRDRSVMNYYQQHIAKDASITPVPGAWDGVGPIPRGSEFLPTRRHDAAPLPFAARSLSTEEWELRCDVAAACRLISRLNGHVTHEGSFAHISVPLPGTETSDEPRFLVTPSDVPFAAMRASLLVVCDARGAVVRGTGYVDGETFRAFHRIRDAGTPGRYGAVLFSHTEFTDRLAAHGRRIRMVSQSAFNFAFDYFGYFDAWGHSLIEACEDADGDKFRENLVDYVAEDDKVFVMLSHGGCLARGDDVAHVFSLLHGIDAAAEIQVYAEMTGFPVMELDKDEVKTFPTHGYGDFRSKSKRMGLNFDANKRLLLCDFNHGFRDTGDSAFVL
jgi:ribulose-5-phosphate 4-epimerase/fuculose-1-phosphate aldolase